jgi:Ca2+-binding EF-hand superfamily protein
MSDGGGVPGWTDRIIQQMSNFLFQYRLELASLYRAIDNNNDGVISAEEFREGFVKLNRVFNMLLTEEQIELIMKAIDRDGNGQITYAEFLRAFKVVDTTKEGLDSPSSSRTPSPDGSRG